MHLPKANITSFGHRPWSNRDLAKLSYGYERGYSIDQISRIVNRSLTATNKALTRHGIRNYMGPKKTRYSDIVHDVFNVTSQHTNNIELETELEIEVELEMESLLDGHACEINTGDCIKSVGTPAGCALLDFEISPRIDTKDIYMSVKIKHIINELIRRGINILPFPCPHHRQQGYKYLVNGKPHTSSGLLLLINKLRLDQGLSLYFIDELTEY